MTKSLLLSLMAATSLLAACGGSSSSADMEMEDPEMDDPGPTNSAVENADGTITVVSGGETLTLPATSISSNGQPQWIGSGLLANGFDTDDALAVGGVQDGTAFSAITGTTVTAPASSLTYVGRYAVNTATGSVSSPLTINYDAVAETISAVDGDFSIDGDVEGTGGITGTVTFEGDTADFDGGFFGVSADVAGAFNSDTFGGVFYGSDLGG